MTLGPALRAVLLTTASDPETRPSARRNEFASGPDTTPDRFANGEPVRKPVGVWEPLFSVGGNREVRAVDARPAAARSTARRRSGTPPGLRARAHSGECSQSVQRDWIPHPSCKPRTVLVNESGVSNSQLSSKRAPVWSSAPLFVLAHHATLSVHPTGGRSRWKKRLERVDAARVDPI